MFPFPWTLDHGSNPDPMMQPIWTPTANTVLPVPGMGGRFSGGGLHMQQQAQSQAQISSLQQQNALLNQQLATQAASHIHQLQQFLQSPNPNPPSSSPTPQAPTPSEPPQLKVPPEVKLPIHLHSRDGPEDSIRLQRGDDEHSPPISRRSSSSNPSHPTSSYDSATTTTGATWRSTTFQHSTVTCPTPSITLTTPHQRPLP